MCAGPYSLALLGIGPELSDRYQAELELKADNEVLRPGQVRISLTLTLTLTLTPTLILTLTLTLTLTRYLATSLYAVCVEHAFRLFRPEQFLFLRYEDMSPNPNPNPTPTPTLQP